MAKLLPFRAPERARRDREPRLVNLDDESADEVFAALSSDTARRILGRLYEEPATASDVAEAVDTSLQNARYHLDKLRDAGLIEAVDTWYSSRGTEMTVYAPTSEPLVVAAGGAEHASALRAALGRVIGAVAVLALASALVDRAIQRFVGPRATGAGPDGDVTLQAARGTETEAAAGAARTTTPAEAAGGGTPTAAETPVAEATEAAMDTATGGATSTPAAAGSPTPTGTPAPSPTPASTPTPAPAPETADGTGRFMAETVVGTTTPAGAGGGPLDVLGTLPPGALFFAGGLLVLLLASGWWYWTRYRPLYG